ncbi:ROK family transcriptional regulator [Paramaledivibacter caminithermalis]|jgi:glucokinase-like ROK family protein|uniref:ROK family protein (Putative glucokinase) n=1 Tax=Paramaledivibacter caminithermalis (strain DSM 15212 / CIP 107654 / DViRD3) TaxID=1121301 RepID=A0A1M6NPG8_PARC5|nr:ROK family transcriptional regulator [Paramaledivibacter caminithermalis]SHJ97462.1 ROK family protein (putative glucokinase) [Paramaledivibacter caminithermalis DSM 15212]
MNINKADKKLIKKINTVSILKVIREKGPISRADISKIIGLNPATVSSNVSDLLNQKIIEEVGSGESSGGRKPILLELNTNEIFVIGVDMGIRKVTAGLINIDGKVINKVTLHFKMETDRKQVIKTMKNSIYEVVKGFDDKLDKIIGIGMGIHGPVDSEKGVSIYAPAFNWSNVNIANIFEDEFKVPVIIDNDCRAMALGEKWFGKAKTSKNFVLLNIGTGIGAGIYLNGDLYRGSNFGAGEIGHVSITHNKIKCQCGKYGCFEAVASGVGIVRRFVEKIEEGKKTSILNKMSIKDITSEKIYEEALQGDKLSIQILNETGRYIGDGLSIIINILNPEMILMAGGVARASEFIFGEIKETIEKKSINNNLKSLYIGETDLKENAGIVGAATLIIRDIFTV